MNGDKGIYDAPIIVDMKGRLYDNWSEQNSTKFYFFCHRYIQFFNEGLNGLMKNL